MSLFRGKVSGSRLPLGRHRTDTYLMYRTVVDTAGQWGCTSGGGAHCMICTQIVAFVQ